MQYSLFGTLQANRILYKVTSEEKYQITSIEASLLQCEVRYRELIMPPGAA